MLDVFDGMYAFAFYDRIKDELIVARDRVGIKPLYIGASESGIIYSSEYSHVINAGFIKDNGVDHKALGNYLRYGFMLAGEGIIQNTFTMPPGHYIVASNSGYSMHKFYEFIPSAPGNKDGTENIFRASVQSQLISDVPLGAFLSGGVDSPLINYWANESKPVEAFTIGNAYKTWDESFYAKAYAERMGLKHHFREIDEPDFLNLINDNFKAFSEPFADFSSIPTMLVAKTAKEHATVILAGDGPDELFWGYDRNIHFPAKANLFRQSKLMLALRRVAGEKNISRKYFMAPDLFSFYAQSLQLYGATYWMDKVYQCASKKNNFYLMPPVEYLDPQNMETSMQMARWLEMNFHLPRILLKVDKATMFYSLEARVPYLSNAVLDHAASLSYIDCVQEGQGKSNIKKIFEEKFMPEWAYKKKQGFNVPMREWINGAIKDDVYKTILDMPAELSDAFDKQQLKNMLDEHTQNGKHKESNWFIWAIYSLVKWHHLHRKPAVFAENGYTALHDS